MAFQKKLNSFSFLFVQQIKIERNKIIKEKSVVDKEIMMTFLILDKLLWYFSFLIKETRNFLKHIFYLYVFLFGIVILITLLIYLTNIKLMTSFEKI